MWKYFKWIVFFRNTKGQLNPDWTDLRSQVQTLKYFKDLQNTVMYLQ